MVVSGPVVPIGVRIGYAKAPEAKVVLMSLSNAATTFTCNGTTPTVTWQAADTVGYYAHVTVTGLSEFTEYGYTVTQGANSVSGSFRTLPGVKDDFSFYVITCDPNWRPTLFGSTPPTGHGFYKNIHEQVAARAHLPCAGILHIDDHGYNAYRMVYIDGGVAGPASTWGGVTGTYTVHDYVAAWFSYYGLLPDIDHGYTWDGIPNATQEAKINNAIGTNPDRVWCMQNLPVWPQWGDWEFQNDLGFDASTTNPDVDNGFHKTYVAGVGQFDGGGYLAWQYFMSHLQPPTARSADTVANHWAFSCGPVRIAAPDFITNSNNGGTDPTTGNNVLRSPLVSFTAMVGADQVVDLLNAVNTDDPFKLFGMSNSHRYLFGTDATEYAVLNGEYSSGVQHPWYNHQPTEYARFMTDVGATPKSLGDNPRTNGTHGVSVFMHGDLHTPYVYKHADAYCRFWEIGVATVHGSTAVKPGVVPEHSHQGTEVVYSYTAPGNSEDFALHGDDYAADGGPASYRHYFGARVDVYGSRSRPEMHITLYGWNDEVLWQGKFLANSSNEAFDTDYAAPDMVGTFGGALM